MVIRASQEAKQAVCMFLNIMVLHRKSANIFCS